MLDKYTTIEKEVNGEIIEKKSKFIANVFPVDNEEEALKRLEEVRKFHRDARHNVFVYRIANGNERASDDGEPSGTAGVPILDILRGMKLQNVLLLILMELDTFKKKKEKHGQNQKLLSLYGVLMELLMLNY